MLLAFGGTKETEMSPNADDGGTTGPYSWAWWLFVKCLRSNNMYKKEFVGVDNN